MVPPLLVLGNANVDLVMGEVDGWPAVGTEIVVPRSEMRPGGSGGNTALALTGMGVRHHFIAAVGDDVLGRWLAEAFDPESTTWITLPSATSLTVGIVHHGGDRAFLTTPGHLQAARIEEVVERIPQAHGATNLALISGGMLMPHYRDGTGDLLATLQERGWRTAIDPGWPPQGWTTETKRLLRRWIRLADMALLNAEEATGVSDRGDVDQAIAALSAELSAHQVLVVKRGSVGAAAVSAGRRFSAVAPQVDVVDTVGAGDTFNAAFLAALSMGKSLRAAVEAGVSAASFAISTYPRRYEFPQS